MEEKQRIAIDVDSVIHFGSRKATFTANFELDEEEIAKFLVWCAWNSAKGIGYEEYLKKNLETMRDLVGWLWGKNFFEFIRGRQEELATYFEDKIRDQMDADDDFKRECYENCAYTVEHDEFGDDYQSWWEASL